MNGELDTVRGEAWPWPLPAFCYGASAAKAEEFVILSSMQAGRLLRLPPRALCTACTYLQHYQQRKHHPEMHLAAAAEPDSKVLWCASPGQTDGTLICETRSWNKINCQQHQDATPFLSGLCRCWWLRASSWPQKLKRCASRMPHTICALGSKSK
eukprot:1144014-Pelagomonas_calceolata.AAC.4